MNSMEVFHEIIHNNLCLLKEKGHKISFEEGMFRHRNQPGFEKVGHALLSVIDPSECNKSIPWPLCNDKTAKNDFRINFVKFIKMVNEKHRDAQIPEMTASNLQHPGGEKFLRFLYKLSTFAVKLEVGRMMGADQENTLLSYPDYSNTKICKETSIHLNILRGAICQLESSALQFSKLESAAIPTLQQLKTINNHLVSHVNSAKAKLDIEISKLSNLEGFCKEILQDIEDHSALSAWNQETEEKIKEMETTCQKLCESRDLSAKSCELIEAVEKTSKDTLCLDGSLLLIPKAVSELAGSPVINTQGQVKLNVLLRAGEVAAHRLAPPPQPTLQSPLQPFAHTLMANIRQQNLRATDITQCLLNLISESKEAIEEQITAISDRLKVKEIPDHVQLLIDRPTLQFLCGVSSPKVSFQIEKGKRMSLNTMENVQLEKTKKVVCSVMRRRSVSKYSFEQTPRTLIKSTPGFGFKVPLTSVCEKPSITSSSLARTLSNRKTAVSRNVLSTVSSNRKHTTPACKRSIYGKLPTGSRIQEEEDVANLSLPDALTGDGNSFSEASLVNESQLSSALADDTSTVEHLDAVSPPKKPRKSLLDIVERYKKIRATMAPTTTNKKQ